MAPVVLDIKDGWPLLPPHPDEPHLPFAFPLASSDTAKAVTKIWNILSFLSFPLTPEERKSLARSGSPHPQIWLSEIG